MEAEAEAEEPPCLRTNSRGMSPTENKERARCLGVPVSCHSGEVSSSPAKTL